MPNAWPIFPCHPATFDYITVPPFRCSRIRKNTG